jgi:hypothetical protein
MKDELIEPLVPPPDAQRVARRAMVLSAIVGRVFLERAPKDPKAIDGCNRTIQWVEQLRLKDELEPSEEKLLYGSQGKLKKEQCITGSWNAEGLSILAWALRLFDFPKHDQQVNPFQISGNLGFLNEKAAAVIKSAKLRPAKELSACRELLYALHCRLREFPRNNSAKNIKDWIEPTWLKALGIDSPLGSKHDLKIGDVELSMADEENIQLTESIICGRHRAIIWLVGEGGPLYSEVSVDT